MPVRRSFVGVMERLAPGWADGFVASSFARPRRRSLLDVHFDPLGQPSYLSILGERIAVWDRGTGPAILLVHGWEGSHRDLDVFSEVLRAAGRRVIAMDFPGHGLSSGQALSVPVMAQVIRQILALKAPEGLEAAVAHSLGGAALISALAEAPLDARLVLLGSPTQAKTYLVSTMKRLDLNTDRYDDVRKRYLKRSGIDINELDAAPHALKLRSKALLIYGDRDRVVPVGEGERYRAHLRNSQLAVLEEASHRGLLCDSRAVAKAVKFIVGPHGLDPSMIRQTISRFQRARRLPERCPIGPVTPSAAAEEGSLPSCHTRAEAS